MKLSLRCLLLVALLLQSVSPSFGQHKVQNMPEHDNKQYYFGLTFAFNVAQFRVRYTDAYAQTDTFKSIQPYWGPGFTLGLMGNLKLHKYVDLRTTPSLQFSEKKLQFQQTIDPVTGRQFDTIQNRTVEAIYFTFPLQLKFKSDRIRNFRFYALGGAKIDYDLAANRNSRKSSEFLKFKPFDAGYEIGFGFEWYYPNFIFSPEIKLSQGLVDQIYRDKSLPLTNAIESITTRTIVISIHLEG